jgi:DNA-binding CsgD family transcriptional regulator
VRDDCPIGSLTIRERETLGYLAEGLTTREIADRMGLTITTVRNHVQRVLRKMGVHSKLAAVVMAKDLQTPRA